MSDFGTQHNRVLQMLDEAEAVCSTTFLAEFIPRAGARIWDLRQEGYAIETRRCRQHKHRTRQIEYRLLARPGQPRQAEMALA